MTSNKKLLDWVEEVKSLCKPDSVYWTNGSQEEYDKLIQEMVTAGTAIPLNQQKRPGCYLFRSHPSDVARVEDQTFIACKNKDDAGDETQRYSRGRIFGTGDIVTKNG